MANIQQVSEHLYLCIQRSLLVLAISGAGIMLSPLQSQGQPATGSSPDAAASVTPVPRIVRPTLRPESQGAAVVELQALLRLLGFYSGPVTGTYTELTQDAVEQFQTAAGLTSDGIVGPATWSRLLPAPASEATPPIPQPAANPVSTTSSSPANPPAANSPTAQPPAATSPSRPLLRLGAEGEAVSQLQRQLQTLGFYQGTIDGIFGMQTEQAVKAAQERYDLTPDGVVGPATWRALGSQN